MNARPFLTLDFQLMAQRGYLDPILTFSRERPASCANPQIGFLETAAANVPRLGTSGLFIENGMVNRLLYTNATEALATTPTGWWADAGSSLQITNEAPAFLDGRNWRYVFGGAQGSYVAATKMTVTIGIGYTLSTWIWVPSAANFSTINLSCDGVAVVSADMSRRDQWQRVTLSLIANANDHYATLRVDGAGGIFYGGGWQLEDGNVATSYTPTAGDMAWRPGEVCYTEQLSPWLNRAAFTLVASATHLSPATATGGRIFELGKQTGWRDAIMAVFGSGGLSIGINRDGTTQADAIVPATPGRYTIAVLFAGGRAVFAINGVIVGAKDGVILPDITRLSIGAGYGGDGFHDDYIQRLQILPYAVPDSVLKAMSALN